MKKEIGKIVLVQERISEKRVLTFEKKSEKGPRSNTKKKVNSRPAVRKIRSDQNSWNLDSRAVGSDLFAHFAHSLCVFTKNIHCAFETDQDHLITEKFETCKFSSLKRLRSRNTWNWSRLERWKKGKIKTSSKPQVWKKVRNFENYATGPVWISKTEVWKKVLKVKKGEDSKMKKEIGKIVLVHTVQERISGKGFESETSEKKPEN